MHCTHAHTVTCGSSLVCVRVISIHGHRHAHLFLSVLFLVSLYFVLKSFFHLFLIPAMVPDENSMEDPLCNSSFGSMVSLDYVTPDLDGMGHCSIDGQFKEPRDILLPLVREFADFDNHVETPSEAVGMVTSRIASVEQTVHSLRWRRLQHWNRASALVL